MLIFEPLFLYIWHQSASETMVCLMLSGSLACHMPDNIFFALLWWIGGKSCFRYCIDDYEASCGGSSG